MLEVVVVVMADIVEWPQAAEHVRTADEPSPVGNEPSPDGDVVAGRSHSDAAAGPAVAGVHVRSHIAVLLHSQVR